MPVYRDAEGNVVEKKTESMGGADKRQPPAPEGRRGNQDDISTDGSGSDRAGKRRPPVPEGNRGNQDGIPTKPMGGTGKQQPPVPGGNRGNQDDISTDLRDDNEGKTRIIGPRRKKDKERTGETDAMTDPVVGWLVIVEGPGKGRAMQLGYGMNAIGRGKTNRICVDFGDDQISRSEHAIVTYDPRGRTFYVQHGGGTNLTYMGGDMPVLAPTALPALSHISIGNTVLRFVPLCGEAFDWQDT